jgi:hypothetical protein
VRIEPISHRGGGKGDTALSGFVPSGQGADFAATRPLSIYWAGASRTRVLCWSRRRR